MESSEERRALVASAVGMNDREYNRPITESAGRARRLSMLAAALAALLVAACGSAGPTPTPALRTRYVYTHFVFPSRTAWKPGETIRLSWTPTSVRTAEREPLSTELQATLTGPFASAEALKEAVTAAASGQGSSDEVVLPTAQRRVSITPIIQSTVGSDTLTANLRLPPDLPPGYYNLTQALIIDNRSGSTVTRGDGTIQVLPGPAQP